MTARLPIARLDPDALAARYVAVWNEPGPALRRRQIEALWSSDGASFTRTLEARGYDALEARVRTSHEKWIRDGGCTFRLRNAAFHHNALRLMWEMVSISDGRLVSVGLDLLLLGEEGRIREDYQFIE